MANILVAEDDPSMRQFIAKALVRAGHSVTARDDGLTAYAALSLDRYDLLVTDIVMPGMDGMELARKAAALFPTLKIVFITGFAAMTLDETGASRSTVPVISKPFHLGQLTAEIDRILAS